MCKMVQTRQCYRSSVHLIAEFYYLQYIKRELKGKHICGCRCNERLKAKTEGSTRLACTQFGVERGTGTPKDRDEVKRREFSECDG
jgi:hypothetical protein